ncbi:glycosyltransferase family 4 protein [Acinetobacter seifertii]|uniref:glycosyltransferase family 4 protein n=1 Tax=Acinetobacter seifertii TaxID=1530123 RepID=UPI000C1DF45D|nr:glycosyltransferase family 4 protein [Acinetobacter seifertii]PJF04567.1 glycosyltransferase family 1 protein [Acinetobacter seifertii]PJG71596.1 glycosyltransferase family 1 protein [Acinetobacter seifertii]HEM6635109.1 glycosyltransferase family 4 protein [Acinetobacter nosocomialis]
MFQSKKIILIGNTSSTMLGFRSDLIKELIENHYEVYAFVCEYSEEHLKKISQLGAKPVIYKMNRGGLNPFADLKTIIELKRKIIDIKPDVIFSYFTKPVVYGSLAARLSHTPKIIGMIEGLGTPFTIHKNGQSLKVKLIRFIQVSLYKIVFPFLDKIIFLNPDDPIDLIQKNNIKAKKNAVQMLGPIGLNLEEYEYKKWDETQQVSFIFIARLLAEKGIFEYLEAAKIVKHKYPNVTFKIIGGLDTENPYGLTKQQLDEVIATGVIEYPGFVTDVAKRIQDSAVFVLPSYYREGVPRSTQEAMAIGRPVITTDVPGCRETVVDGLNGFLVPKWDPKALAEKMCYFIENPEQINIMGLEGYRIAQENFDVSKVNKKLFEIMGLEDTNEKTY